MSYQSNIISPLEISHSMKSIFIVKRSPMNAHITDDIEMAEVKEIKLRDIYNDAENGKIIINRNMKDEQPFSYSYRGIYKNEDACKVGAAEVNRSESAKIDKVLTEMAQTMQQLEKVQKAFDELKKVNLI